MSTSVYRSEQVVHYSGEHVVTYYGFYVSWNGGEGDCVYPFGNAERREDWVREVRAAAAGFDEYEGLLAAALLACATWGPESCRDGIAWAFANRYDGGRDGSADDVRETLEEVASRFDPSEPAGTPLRAASSRDAHAGGRTSLIPGALTRTCPAAPRRPTPAPASPNLLVFRL